MTPRTRQGTEEELFDIYVQQYAQYKEISSNLDTQLPKITSIYEGFCTELLADTPLSKENISFTNVVALITAAPPNVMGSDKMRRLMAFNLDRV